MHDLTELILLKRLKEGDRKAMRDFYGLHSGPLKAVCSRYILDTDAVNDILQEAFIKIFLSVGKFEYRGEGSLGAWARKIVVNESLKYLKNRMRFGQKEELPEDIPDEDNELEINDIPQQVIQEMIKRLPDGYRAVFNLYVFEDMSHKEIAALLGIKENSSSSQFHRAKALLVKWIKEYQSK